MKLHLGVIDVPYGHQDPARRGRKPAKTPNETTGDVAQILEDRYGVMAKFWGLHGQEVADAMTAGLVAEFESLALGAPRGRDPYAGAMDVAKNLFSRFLESKEMDGLANGVPTAASLAGVSHRFKRKRGAPGRPSFVDTGLFEASFRVWVEAQG